MNSVNIFTSKCGIIVHVFEEVRARELNQNDFERVN
jgi:hypothetical protein